MDYQIAKTNGGGIGQPIATLQKQVGLGVCTTREHLKDEVSRLNGLAEQFCGVVGVPLPPEQERPAPSNMAESFGDAARGVSRAYDLLRQCFVHISG